MKKLLSILFFIVSVFIISCKKENDNNTLNKLVYSTVDNKIVQINQDGTDKKILISLTGDNVLISQPINGKFIYTNYAPTTEKATVYLFDINNNTNTKIIEENNNFSYVGVSLSHNGSKILLKVLNKNAVDSIGRYIDEIGLIDNNGQNLQILTNGHYVHENVPVFSPDDKKIAFYSYYNFKYSLYVIDINGDNLTLLDNNIISVNEDGLYINWNSNSSKLAYVSRNSLNNYNLSIIDSSGTNKDNLLNNVNINDPIWSNQNSKIIFSMYDDSENFSNIFSINSNGTGLINLTNSTLVDKYYTSPEYNTDNTMLSFIEKYYDPNRINDDDVLASLYVLNSSNNDKQKISTNDIGYPYKAFWIK